MKKVLFKTILLLSIVCFSSCSSNEEEALDGGTINEIKMTIDGKNIVFNKVAIGIDDYHAYGGDASKLTGTINGSTDKVITIVLLKNKVGSGSLAEVTYIDNGKEYRFNEVLSFLNCSDNTKLTFITSKNDGTSFSGNFSGKIESCEKSNKSNILGTINITKGSFSVKK
ncbi:hypothetical protein DS884_06465 [Tenacibaculum sp. E3R01]|uniref:hypothetical protein n=1 Tax=Tenacibaculum sp. E3R01 TaxID=2267227 RepID=UPI000DEBFB40|nr:hypothetical protein [Tenacibaculum sp. E3R01]RBW59377.1 hypothetical protein DS884_06465 [Tenacibaculum sp. E3R01]